MNYNTATLILTGSMTEDDQILMSWKGDQWADCNPTNFMGNSYIYKHEYLFYIWCGRDSGMHGMNLTSDELHLRWKSKTRGALEN